MCFIKGRYMLVHLLNRASLPYMKKGISSGPDKANLSDRLLHLAFFASAGVVGAWLRPGLSLCACHRQRPCCCKACMPSGRARPNTCPAPGPPSPTPPMLPACCTSSPNPAT
jgi:hypothetical protein